MVRPQAADPRDVRQSIHDRDEWLNLISRMKRAESLGISTGLGTLGTGVWLVFLTTGFGDAPLTIYLALAAVLAMIAVGALVASPAWREIQRGLESEDLPRAAARLSSFTGALRLEGLLWILALTAMLL